MENLFGSAYEKVKSISVLLFLSFFPSSPKCGYERDRMTQRSVTPFPPYNTNKVYVANRPSLGKLIPPLPIRPEVICCVGVNLEEVDGYAHLIQESNVSQSPTRAAT